MTTKANNHTDSPKTDYITCKGYVDKSGKTVFAEGHEQYRLVHPQDKKQTKRCVACQKAHMKVIGEASRKKAQARGKDKGLVEAAKKAAATEKAIGGKLSKAGLAELHKAQTAGKAAEVRLAKVAAK